MLYSLTEKNNGWFNHGFKKIVKKYCNVFT